MLDEVTMEEVIRRAGSAGLLRTNHTESKRLIEHLLANGFQYVGPSLERAQPRGKPHAFTPEGKPIWKR
jgi:hypothetical protein